MGRFGETLVNLALARSTVERRAERRAEPDLLPRLLSDPLTRVLPVHDGTAQVSPAPGGSGVGLVLRSPEPEDGTRLAVYLGEEAGTAYLAVLDPTGGPEWRSLRHVGVELTDRDAGLLTTALGVTNWHAAHTHCPRCGAPTELSAAGWTRTCPQDLSEHYPRTDPAVIMSVVDDQDRLLLARGAQWAERRYSVLAGFVEPGETLADAVAREVFEEVGLRVGDVRYLGDQPWPFPSSLMVGFTARALGTDLVFRDGEIAEARWFTRALLREELAAGTSGVSPRLSIARRLVEHWYGEEITDVP